MQQLMRPGAIVGRTTDSPSLAHMAERPREVRSRLAALGHDLLSSRGVVIGGALFLTLVLIALFAPAIAPQNPIEQDYAATLRPPSREHLMGTDNFGRDIFSRVVFGTRISLRVGLISVGIAAAIGIPIGLAAGYYGGWVDGVAMRLIDVMLAFPGILLAFVFVAVLGSSLTNLMIAIGIGSIPGFARLIRGSVLATLPLSYVEAARVIGCRDPRIVHLHILPNVTSPIIVYSTLKVATAILAGASLSFLGLGVQRPTPEWGVMLADGRNFLQQQWWIAAFPGLAIMVTTLAINLLGDGLRDLRDPRTQRA
ncbi:MAG: ABC transporter permease [Chloroflexota bacterium]|nr:ABC transporter permease [Chloroflexota bacterium]